MFYVSFYTFCSLILMASCSGWSVVGYSVSIINYKECYITVVWILLFLFVAY